MKQWCQEESTCRICYARKTCKARISNNPSKEMDLNIKCKEEPFPAKRKDNLMNIGEIAITAIKTSWKIIPVIVVEAVVLTIVNALLKL